MIRTVCYKKSKIEYSLIRKPVLNINIRVHANKTVMVSAHPKVPVQVLDEFVIGKAKWILACFEKYDRRDKLADKKMEYVNGETVRILGRDFEINVEESKKERILVENNRIYMLVKNKDDFAKKKRLYEKWYDSQCEKAFYTIVEESYPLFRKYSIPMPEVKIRKMKTRWGSCSPSKKAITLNKILFMSPKRCIEYVVVHELAHFVHANHSKSFYKVVEGLMPDYKERKVLLEK